MPLNIAHVEESTDPKYIALLKYKCMELDKQYLHKDSSKVWTVENIDKEQAKRRP